MPTGVFKRSVTTTFQKQKIKIIGFEDLVAMKVYAGSHKDIQDIIGILQVSAKKIDILALRKIISQYGKRESERLNRLLPNRLFHLLWEFFLTPKVSRRSSVICDDYLIDRNKARGII
ncbi:MAG: nucleotidyltransferase [Candidatus Omnitrophica bacterium]|nr:nucleotidyltransferase [Candidatus Omnitrophota bacterium]